MDNNTSSTYDSPDANNREAMLQELVIRLSTFPGDQRVSNPHVLLGQLPKELPPDIPLPEGSRVLGTLIRGPEYATSVLDVDLPTEQVLDFYRERMQAAGWQESELPKGLRPGGFTHTGFRLDTRATFCRSSRGPALAVIAQPRGDASTDLRLVIDLSGKSCSQQARISKMMGRTMGMQEMIPRLDPPPGGKQVPNGGGGGMDGFQMDATLYLDAPMDLARLAAHYATQLERAGWTRDTEEQSGPIALNTWTFRDEDNQPGQGFFFVLRMPGQKQQYMLHVRVDSGTGGEQFGGWFSSAPLTRLT